MKKRILFVDDEDMVLQGLRRMLRPLREEWDMEFAESSVKALELMAKNPFDVIVSDMRMPGMNGAELLNEVMMRYPKTVRLILSGQAEKDIIVKCVGVTHQYLAKPCDPDALRATIARATSLEFSVSNERSLRWFRASNGCPVSRLSTWSLTRCSRKKTSPWNRSAESSAKTSR